MPSLRVSNVFVSKFDQAMYWMDRAKRAGVPRKMQIEGLLEELKLDLLKVLVPDELQHWKETADTYMLEALTERKNFIELRKYMDENYVHKDNSRWRKKVEDSA